MSLITFDHSYAQTCNCSALGGTNVRDSYKVFGNDRLTEARNCIFKCIESGSDYPEGWELRGGQSSRGTKNTPTVIQKSALPSPGCSPPPLSDLLFCNDVAWPNCNGSPGGISQPISPGTDTCVITANAAGYPTPGSPPPPPILINNLPPELACATGFVASLGATFSTSGQACLQGGISWCGGSLGGEVCFGGEDGRDGVVRTSAYLSNAPLDVEVGYGELIDSPSAFNAGPYAEENPNYNILLPEGGYIDLGTATSNPPAPPGVNGPTTIDLPPWAVVAVRADPATPTTNAIVVILPTVTYTIPTTDINNTIITSNPVVTNPNGGGDYIFSTADPTTTANSVPQYSQAWLANQGLTTPP